MGMDYGHNLGKMTLPYASSNIDNAWLVIMSDDYKIFFCRNDFSISENIF